MFNIFIVPTHAADWMRGSLESRGGQLSIWGQPRAGGVADLQWDEARQGWNGKTGRLGQTDPSWCLEFANISQRVCWGWLNLAPVHNVVLFQPVLEPVSSECCLHSAGHLPPTFKLCIVTRRKSRSESLSMFIDCSHKIDGLPSNARDIFQQRLTFRCICSQAISFTSIQPHEGPTCF